MGFEELQTFVAIALLGGFSRAAEDLHRSQPAISRRIELLERELGATLFERVHAGSILTDAGAALLPHAEAALAAARDGANAVDVVMQGAGGSVSLAVVGTLANDGLTTRLREFRSHYPKVRLDLQTAGSQEVGDLVQRGEATLGLRYLDDLRPNLVSKAVTEETLLVVCNPEHRLADGRPHKPVELAGERWVAFPARASRESFVQHVAQKLFAAGLETRDIIPIDSLTAQKRMVEAGFGIALLAESGVREEVQAGALRVVDVPALQIRIPVRLVHRRNGFLSPAARFLMSLIAAAPG